MTLSPVTDIQLPRYPGASFQQFTDMLNRKSPPIKIIPDPQEALIRKLKMI